ncbi:hypothetical protein ACP70R_043222 [Stipagrostis hirtigluma subsp. patula]
MRSTSTDTTEPPESPIPPLASDDRASAAQRQLPFAPWEFRLLRSGPGYAERRNRQVKGLLDIYCLVKA